jgi:hypothetical protein
MLGYEGVFALLAGVVLSFGNWINAGDVDNLGVGCILVLFPPH